MQNCYTGDAAEHDRSLPAVKSAQRRGVKFGRKVRLTGEPIDDARSLIDNGKSRPYFDDLLNVGRVTLYRALAG